MPHSLAVVLIGSGLPAGLWIYLPHFVREVAEAKERGRERGDDVMRVREADTVVHARHEQVHKRLHTTKS